MRARDLPVVNSGDRSSKVTEEWCRLRAFGRRVVRGEGGWEMASLSRSAITADRAGAGAGHRPRGWGSACVYREGGRARIGGRRDGSSRGRDGVGGDDGDAKLGRHARRLSRAEWRQRDEANDVPGETEEKRRERPRSAADRGRIPRRGSWVVSRAKGLSVSGRTRGLTWASHRVPSRYPGLLRVTAGLAASRDVVTGCPARKYPRCRSGLGGSPPSAATARHERKQREDTVKANGCSG